MQMIHPRPLVHGKSGALVAMLLVASFSWGCAPAPRPSIKPGSSAVGATASIRIHATGISNPTDGDELPDGSLIIGGRDGRIFRVAGDGSLELIGDISAKVLSGGERGLLGIAVSPPTATSGERTLYATYNRRGDGATVLVAARLMVAPYRVFGVSEPFVVIDHYNPNHNGGDIVLIADGLLIVATGDSGGSGDPFNAAQSLESNLGKLLLVDLRGPDLKVKIVARGLRNPWKMAVDSRASNLWIADVGQDNFEEVNRVSLDAVTGSDGSIVNFGWPILEGDGCFRASPCTPPAHYLAPLWTYRHGPACSIIGGAVSGGEYLYSDYCDARIYALPLDATIGTPPTLLLPLGEGRRPSSMFSTRDGRVWVLDIERGEVLELVLSR